MVITSIIIVNVLEKIFWLKRKKAKYSPAVSRLNDKFSWFYIEISGWKIIKTILLYYLLFSISYDLGEIFNMLLYSSNVYIFRATIFTNYNSK